MKALFQPFVWLKQNTQPSVGLFLTVAVEWPLRLALLTLALPFFLLGAFGKLCIAIDDERERQAAAGIVKTPDQKIHPPKKTNRPLLDSYMLETMLLSNSTSDGWVTGADRRKARKKGSLYYLVGGQD